MHLLYIKGLPALRLQAFIGPQKPRYAILSHMWRDEEILFDEIELPLAKVESKLGYSKILQFCNLAKVRGFDYVWVDTCCIDKSSSAELSEAINSMYEWYRNAELCYAYLDDINSLESFRASKSRWFTRGWTLQELLAPDSLELYDRHWRCLGTKLTLGAEISAKTGIELRALEGWPLAGFCAANKMCWISRRQTTRPEDIAYCLLGIFGVNMPLLYGEGSKAFVRLQETIMRQSQDHSLFAWSSEPSPDHDVPGTPAFGLLAPHHRCFHSGNNVLPLHNSTRKPCEITDIGIRLTLPVLTLETNVMAAAIDCEIVHPSESLHSISRCWLGLWPGSSHINATYCHPEQQSDCYRRTSLFIEPNVEQRIRPESREKHSNGESLIHLCRERTIFVERGSVGSVDSNHFEFAGVIVNFRLSESGYTCTALYPLHAWEDVDRRGTRFCLTSTSIKRQQNSRDWCKIANERRLLGALLLSNLADDDRIFILIHCSPALKHGFDFECRAALYDQHIANNRSDHFNSLQEFIRNNDFGHGRLGLRKSQGKLILNVENHLRLGTHKYGTVLDVRFDKLS